MIKKKKRVAILTTSIFALLAACGYEAEEADEPAARDMRDAVEDAGESLSNVWEQVSAFAADQSEQFVSAIQGAKDETQARAEPLLEAGEDTSEEAVERFRAAREELSAQLKKAEDATEETWEDVKADVETALTEFRDAYRDLRNG